MTLASLRQAIATRISTIPAPTGWSEAPVPWDLHSASGVPAAVPSSRLHLSYAVGLPETEATGRRHRALDGVRCRSLVTVRVLCRLAPLDQLASLDAALAAEEALIDHLDHQDAIWPAADLTIYWQGTRRAAAPTGDWLLLEVRFATDHTLALT